MDAIIQESASHLLSLLSTRDQGLAEAFNDDAAKAGNGAQPVPSSRLVVAVAGGPGSGKSEFARELGAVINRRCREEQDSQDVTAGIPKSDVAIVVGMDGWHYTRKQLDAFPDPVDAHFRRGAHDTFDAAAYVDFIRALKSPSSAAETIYAPSFDHAEKDPRENSIPIYPHHRIVILEGLYVALDIEPWSEAAAMMDERWLIACEEEEARARVVKRHVKSGICADEESARKRFDGNDLINGRLLLSKVVQPVREIKSMHDSRYDVF